MRLQKSRRLAWIAAAACTAIVAVATLTPEPVLDDPGGVWTWSVFDVAQNLALFAPLGFALVRATASPVASVAAGSALSATVETLQRWIPGRDPSLADWIANTAGTVIGAAIAMWWHRRRVTPSVSGRAR
jgi:VanZ family protein